MKKEYCTEESYERQNRKLNQISLSTPVLKTTEGTIELLDTVPADLEQLYTEQAQDLLTAIVTATLPKDNAEIYQAHIAGYNNSEIAKSTKHCPRYIAKTIKQAQQTLEDKIKADGTWLGVYLSDANRRPYHAQPVRRCLPGDLQTAREVVEEYLNINTMILDNTGSDIILDFGHNITCQFTAKQLMVYASSIQNEECRGAVISNANTKISDCQKEVALKQLKDTQSMLELEKIVDNYSDNSMV